MKVKNKNFWYTDKRAAQLALLHLSRRNDLMLERQSDVSDHGYDLLVTICPNNEITGRIFGVQVKAVMSLKNNAKSAAPSVVKLNSLKARYLEDTPFPICLFVFEMASDRGFYRWLNQPVVAQSNQINLKMNKANLFKTLDEIELNNIVNDVNAWYTSKKRNAG